MILEYYGNYFFGLLYPQETRQIIRPRRGSMRLLTAGLTFAALFSLMGAPLLVAQKASVVVKPVAQEVIAQRLQRLRTKDADRETELKTIFGEAGCPANQVEEEIVRHKDPPNVICTLPGSTTSVIIVGAHFDHVEKGMGGGGRLEWRLFASKPLPDTA